MSEDSIFLFVLIFLFGVIVSITPVQGYTLNTGNTLISYDSSFHIFIDTTNLTTSISMPLYTGTLFENGAL